MANEPRDTGDLARVPESEWNKTDRGEGANALRDYDTPDLPPDDTLADVYEDPGDVVEGSLA